MATARRIRLHTKIRMEVCGLTLRNRVRELPLDASSAGFLPCLARLGWVRHLPTDVGVAFMFVIEACLVQARGNLMREYMEGLWIGAQRCKKSRREQKAVEDSLKRFDSEYGKPWERSLSGAIDVLVDLGLVMRYELDGEEVLDVPDLIPTPEQRLTLNDEERQGLLLLARRAHGSPPPEA